MVPGEDDESPNLLFPLADDEPQSRYRHVSLDCIGAELGAEHVSDSLPDRLAGRTASRAVAVQVLYEADLSNRRVESCINWVASEARLSRRGKEFALSLVLKAESARALVDRKIDSYSHNRRIYAMSPVVRNVLRLAFAERELSPETSRGIIISEAVVLTKTFDSDQAAKFVNGILGAVARDGIDL